MRPQAGVFESGLADAGYNGRSWQDQPKGFSDGVIDGHDA